jgi:L-asparaginase/Glu-tRNA(Gln) amidotransferase subunit D
MAPDAAGTRYGHGMTRQAWLRSRTQVRTCRLEAFQSREIGVLGYADPDRIVYYRALVRRHTTQWEFDLGQISAFPKVTIPLLLLGR